MKPEHQTSAATTHRYWFLIILQNMKLIVTVHWNFLNVSESRPAKIQLPLGAWKVQSDWLMSLSGQMRRSGCLTMVGGAPSPPAWRHRGSVPVLAQDHGGLSSYSCEYFPSKHAALLSGSLTFQWLQTQMCQGFYSWWWSRSPGFHCGWRHYFGGKDSNIYFAWMKTMFNCLRISLTSLPMQCWSAGGCGLGFWTANSGRTSTNSGRRWSSLKLEGWTFLRGLNVNFLVRQSWQDCMI